MTFSQQEGGYIKFFSYICIGDISYGSTANNAVRLFVGTTTMLRVQSPHTFSTHIVTGKLRQYFLI